MCLIGIAIDPPGPWALVVAANRDEYHRRPTSAAEWWSDPGPQAAGAAAADRRILAGRDLLAGGTWLGLQVDRRRRSLSVGALTNIRPGLMPADGPSAAFAAPGRSRGHLVAGWLQADEAPSDHLARLDADSGTQAGFNLFLLRLAGGRPAADPGAASVEAAYLHNLAGDRTVSRPLGPGLHVASNATLDTPWPKTLRLGQALQQAIDACPRDPYAASEKLTAASLALRDRLFDVLADRTESTPEAMPNTGLEADRERLLSAAFIVDPEYGTRCSTVIAVTRAGGVLFSERSFDPDGCSVATVTTNFDL